MLIMTISPSTSAARTLGLRAIRVVSPIPAGLSPDADAELPFGELFIGNASAFRAAGLTADYDRCRHLAFGASCAVAVYEDRHRCRRDCQLRELRRVPLAAHGDRRLALRYLLSLGAL